MSFSSTGVEPSSVQGSPGSNIPPLDHDQMECDDAGNYTLLGDDTYMPEVLSSSDEIVSRFAYFRLS
jgi:hypothetical protein